MDTSEKTAVEQAREWLRQGQTLREKLVAERAELAGRIAEIDAALEKLPPEAVVATPFRAPEGVVYSPPVLRPSEFATARIPDLVRYVLQQGRRKMNAAQVVEAVQLYKADADKMLVYSALNRIKTIHREGPRGSTVYWVADLGVAG